MKKPETKKHISGAGYTCSMAWSTLSDGPMNLISREFPADPITGISCERGDTERIANRAEFLARSLGIKPMQTAVPKLTHGADIRWVNSHNRVLEDLTCDGLITDRLGLALTVGFADCPSVVLVDRHTPVMCLLHVGWRPVSAGIIEKAVSMLTTTFSARRDTLHAFIGPSIQKCCYEVGPDVATKVDGLEHHENVMLDLPDIITSRLIALGIDKWNIETVPECVKCFTVDSQNGEKPLYYSLRRDKKTDPLDTGMFVALLH